jgi:predicted aspartyl protease
MGTFFVSCTVENHVHRKRVAKVDKMLVDTGSEHTWVNEEVLHSIGIKPEKKDVPFTMANGQTITRSIGFAVVRVGEFFTIDEVVFGLKGDLSLLGARTLEGMNVSVDSQRKKLVAAGPIHAA